MTQTPHGFDPQDPRNAAPAQYPVTSEAPSGSVEGYPAGGTADSTDPGAGAPVDAIAVPREEAPRAGTPAPTAAAPEPRRVTRAGMVWTAVASALVVLILLIVFILQNQVYVQVKFFGLEGSVPLGVALFIAAVGGGVLVAIAGAARIIQLRLATHRQRIRLAGQATRSR
ncbi:lipopolysaccharide assembly protein LapA domain-containing protein [Arthrobacter sp. YAF16]|uniref:LapA family protein n=1 Tax=Arthrobacter sp. YAF16 TaxID=3233076 RepID=UPI003F932681